MSKKALVTGAGGFIGSHLVERLVREGWDVRALLHYNSQSSRGNLEHVCAETLQAVDIFWGDLRDALCVTKAVEGCEYIFHLGALVAIPYSYVNPSAFVETNVIGTQHVLNAARDLDSLERVIITSTSEVYGTARYVPIDEAHPVQGQSPYSASKIGADYLAESYARSFELPVGILRPFNTYGPRQSMRAVIPTIIAQLLAGPTVKLGSLTPRRDLTFVEDTADAFFCMATRDIPYGEPINIGQGSDVSIGDLVELLLEITGHEAEVITDAQRVRPEKSEVMQLLAGTAKAQEYLAWAPEHSLRQGLEKTVGWVKEHLHLFRTDEYHI